LDIVREETKKKSEVRESAPTLRAHPEVVRVEKSGLLQKDRKSVKNSWLHARGVDQSYQV
jgi:hypothetical protein